MPVFHSRASYFDHSATTPVRSDVFDAMRPWLADGFGNPGSMHAPGRDARRAVDDAREAVAALSGVAPREVIFTSGGTEANNLAVLGLVEAAPAGRRRVLVSAVEHHAVLHAADRAARLFGAEVVVVPVDGEGRVDPAAVAERLDDATALVAVMHGNNETGVLQPVEAIAALCADRGVPFHVDAVQSAGKAPLDLAAMGASSVALSGHKLYAPKGVGALCLARGVAPAPQMAGGAQESGRRAGTENVAGIVGFGHACALAAAELAETAASLTRLRERFEAALPGAGRGWRVNSAGAARLPHITSARFPGLDGESLVLALDFEGYAASIGSACTSGSAEPSHVLLAMGQSRREAGSAVRFSFGRDNTPEAVDALAAALPAIAARVAP